ncbi:hypothetical protein BX616_001868 [Lobosporangium transversale]|nr:hypothetical protein BX616_001868 [Lobosporangium transversale]
MTSGEHKYQGALQIQTRLTITHVDANVQAATTIIIATVNKVKGAVNYARMCMVLKYDLCRFAAVFLSLSLHHQFNLTLQRVSLRGPSSLSSSSFPSSSHIHSFHRFSYFIVYTYPLSLLLRIRGAPAPIRLALDLSSSNNTIATTTATVAIIVVIRPAGSQPYPKLPIATNNNNTNNIKKQYPIVLSSSLSSSPAQPSIYLVVHALHGDQFLFIAD